MHPAALRQKAFDDAVFQRVKGDDDQSPAELQATFGRTRRLHHLAQLAVHEDPQRLKGLGGGMGRLAGLAPDGALDQPRQFQRTGEGLSLARLTDGAGNGRGPVFLSQNTDDAGQLASVHLVDDVGRTRPRLLHAHVERTVLAEGKPAFRLIHLHGGNAEIEDDAVDRLVTGACGMGIKFGKAARHQCQASAEFLDYRLSVADDIGIAIDRDHVGAPLQDGARVAARTERAVDDRLAIGRRKSVQNFFE